MKKQKKFLRMWITKIVIIFVIMIAIITLLKQTYDKLKKQNKQEEDLLQEFEEDENEFDYSMDFDQQSENNMETMD